MRKIESDLRGIVCITNMDIRSADFKRLPKMHKEIVWKLATIEVRINHCKKYKTNPNAQRDLIHLKDDKKYYQGLKKQIDRRLKRNY